MSKKFSCCIICSKQYQSTFRFTYTSFKSFLGRFQSSLNFFLNVWGVSHPLLFGREGEKQFGLMLGNWIKDKRCWPLILLILSPSIKSWAMVIVNHDSLSAEEGLWTVSLQVTLNKCIISFLGKDFSEDSQSLCFICWFGFLERYTQIWMQVNRHNGKPL